MKEVIKTLFRDRNKVKINNEDPQGYELGITLRSYKQSRRRRTQMKFPGALVTQTSPSHYITGRIQKVGLDIGKCHS